MPLQMRFAHTIRFQIHYVFNTVRVPRHEFRCVDFQASSPGCEAERRLHLAASGKRDEDHPSEIADRTAHSPGPAGRGSVRCQSLVDRNALHFEAEPQVFLTSSR
jgi:hypothetical protein